MVEDDDVGAKFIKRVELLRQQRVLELKREAMGDQFTDERKDLVGINIENAENYEEHEMNRTLTNLLRCQHRKDQSTANRKKYLMEFRDSALKFLKRN